MTRLRFLYENGGYELEAKLLEKKSEFDYSLDDAVFSTCFCADQESRPWSFHADSTDLTYEGYGVARNVSFRVLDIPILYSPYLIFPVKNERQSGLLFPILGLSSQNGFEYTQPVFGVINEHQDLLFTPFIQSDTRAGVDLVYRAALSRNNNIEAEFLFSDESLRDGQRQGSILDSVFESRYRITKVWGSL